MTDRDQLRRQIEEDLAGRRFPSAQAGLERLWNEHASAALAGFINGRYESLRGHTTLHPLRVAVLRSFTVEPVLPLLRATAWTKRLEVTVKAGEFNAYAPELLDPQSWVYSFAPDVAILAVQTRDAVPELWDGFADRTADEVRATVERVLGDFRNWIRTFRSRSQAHLLVHTMELPGQPSRGVLDSQAGGGQAEAIRTLNDGLRRIAGEFNGVYLFDYDALAANCGRTGWGDEQRFATVKLPLRAESMLALGREWVRYLCPLAGRSAKVLAVDLDNTLWGGVVGEEGATGIHADREHPGIAWWNVQRALLDVKRRGILLAICSKNNREDALEAFRANPNMPLRLEDFAAERINWMDKPSNLREIAAELNVGVDSIAFLDDNPTERDRVRLELPEVTVIDLPGDPLGFAAAVRSCPALERLTVSQEDADRSRYYAEQRQRSTAQEGAANVEEFYRSLFQKVEIERLCAPSLARAAQLTQKTNQFNATTRRYSEQQIAGLAETPGCDVYTVRVKDRFGDNGLVGVMITREAEPGICEIDTFLLSCRVIARTVETAMLSFLSDESRARDIATLRGWFLPTAKNAPAADLYRRHGFEAGAAADSGTCWMLDLRRAEVVCPDWIQLSAPSRAEQARPLQAHSVSSKGPVLSEYSAS
jgi:FkbH-like protein